MRSTRKTGEQQEVIIMAKRKKKINTNDNLTKMVFAAVFGALIILMTFTGIGYIPIGPLKLTINVLPVAVGAVMLGPMYGAILGGVFGLSSFFTCFGMDPLGGVLLGINPFLLFVMCVVPRVVCGLVPGILMTFFPQKGAGQIAGTAISCVLTPILNTIGFLTLMWLFFAEPLTHDPQILNMLKGTIIENLFMLFALFAGTNAIVEAATCLVLGTAICKALFVVKGRMS